MPDRFTAGVARIGLIVLCLCGAARHASSQTVIDPDTVEFDASLEHDEVALDGTATVKRYDLSFYQLGAGTASFTISLGKPVPDAAGRIRVNFLSLLSVTPPAGVAYEARVWAVGPGGKAGSEVSGPFTFGAACTYAVTPAPAALTPSGGSLSLTVSASAGCAWSATSSATWVAVSSGASGSGGGTVSLTVAANPSASGRSATVTVAGQAIAISQAGASCSYGLSAASATMPFTGGSGSVGVTAGSGCTWSATSSAPWLTVTGGGAGVGSATIGYDVAVNVGTAQRSATLTVGGQTLTVVQAAQTCSYSFSTTAVTMAPVDSSGSVSLIAPAGCPWVAVSNADWLDITGWSSGTGSAAISFDALDNQEAAARTALISAGGQTLTVTQQGGPGCVYTVSPTSRVVLSTGGTGSLTVTTVAGCAWTASSSAAWLTLSGVTSGNGPGTVTYAVAANPTAQTRTAQLSAGGSVLAVSQGAAPCSYALSSATASLPSSAATGSVQMTAPAGCSWAASSSASWLTVTSPAFNNGGGTVTVSAAANPLTTARTAAIFAGGKTLSVTQAGASSCTVDLSSTRVVLGREASEGVVLATITGACPLAATSDAAWLSVVQADAASGAVRFAAVRNDTSFDRTGSLRIGSAVVTVIQRTTGLPGKPNGLQVSGLGGGK